MICIMELAEENSDGQIPLTNNPIYGIIGTSKKHIKEYIKGRFMAGQIIIQVRVDSELKEKVSTIFEEMGIDIPTAVRMFFKATVREQDLPFKTKVTKESSEREQVMEYFKNIAFYSPPLHSDAETVVVLPLENGQMIPTSMYVQLITKVPVGKITCWEDIFAFLDRLYNKKIADYPERTLPWQTLNGEYIPYWRIVSQRGVLTDGKGGSRETQKEKLENEKVPILQRGSMTGSYKVDNYKEYMFDFEKLKVISED